MKKIVVKIPILCGRKWSVSAFGSTGNKKKKVSSIFNFIEKQVFAKNNLDLEGKLKEETSVLIKDGKYIINESVSSNQPQYLMYCLTVFLEDYLTEYILEMKEKQYEK